MDRPSPEPAPRPAPQPEAAEVAESPLSFPVEAPRPTGPEPGAGAPADPLAFPVAATPLADPPLFPAEAASPSADPLAFPAAATPLTAPPLFPAEPTSPHSSAPLPFPVAELPGVPAPAPLPAPEAAPEATQPATAAAHTPPSPWFRFGPPLLASIAALLAIGGCFLPLFQMFQELDFRQGFADAWLTVTRTAWGTRIQVTGQPPDDRPALPVGIPVVVAIVLLAVAAFAAFSRPDRGLSRWLLSAGAVFTAGVVTTIGVGRLELAAIAGEEENLNLEVTTGPGMWLLAVATVLAAGAAVVAHLPNRAPGWADPAVAYADTPTPPSGVAITVLPPEEPEDEDPRLR